ncbi:MAG TPA: glycosyltransferase family 4 protein [Ktedonobacterales bacterium]|jgi:glycosyltransferase involved in cell wall biosynthesis|nr:glycosyltransferase family 4 protein [Ktedonobacterales bacterium]
MRIAQVAPLYVDTPPRSYGGTERIISSLTDALVEAGHEVTLFATGGSRTKAELVAFVPEAIGFDHLYDSGVAHTALLAEVYRRASEFDVIHSHLDHQAFPFAARSKTPTIFTLHGSLDMPYYPAALRAFRDLRYVSISDSQREPVPDLNWMATVYHGIDVESHPFSDTPGEYLLFVGRISPEKGPEHAIAIAKKANLPLKIAAKVDPKDRKFFEQTIKPLLDDPLIEFLGPVNERRKRVLMKNALALLLPIRWREPFGMVFIESLACGTPVLTCPQGAAPEILSEGVTGYMRESDDELAEAATRVVGVSRAGCRAWAKQRFDISGMMRNYVGVYQAAIDESEPQHAFDIPADVRVEPVVAGARSLTSEQAISQ